MTNLSIMLATVLAQCLPLSMYVSSSILRMSTLTTSGLLQRTLHEVDLFVKDLHDSLSSRNITDIIDIIFVSDHGMTDMSHPGLIYMDDILGEDYSAIEHVDGWVPNTIC
jgi:predicted AlkP superfamily pyrophosphatase or phosphodiesterase